MKILISLPRLLPLVFPLALAACSASPLDSQIVTPAERAHAAVLALSSNNAEDKSSLRVTAINDSSVLQKSDLLLKPGSYKLSVKITQPPNRASGDGTVQAGWMESSSTLQAELKAGHRYVPRSSIKGMMVQITLEETPITAKP